MIRWNVRPLMMKAKIDNASQLATRVGLTYPVASRVVAGAALERIDVATAERLALYFDVKWWALFEQVPQK